MHLPDPITRFQDRAAPYDAYRPGYPPALFDHLRRQYELAPDWRVADIGSGTGRLGEGFLREGCRVWGVEPNGAMRAVAERALAGHDRFTSIDGRAEATGLPASSFELVAAGQAFHWFDPGPFAAEARRILVPSGALALVWNNRRLDEPFTGAYEELIRRHFPDYNPERHIYRDDTIFRRVFGEQNFEIAEFDHAHPLDRIGLAGFIDSVSYAPRQWRNDPAFSESLNRLFEQYEQGGRVTMVYTTLAVIGRPV